MRERKEMTRREFLKASLLGGAGLALAACAPEGAVSTSDEGASSEDGRTFRETYGPNGRTHIVEQTGVSDATFEEAMGEQNVGPVVEGSVHAVHGPDGATSYTPTDGVSQETLEEVFGTSLGGQVQE